MSGEGAAVLLLADRPLVALVACRALGRAGHAVTVASSGARSIAAASRYATRRATLPPILGSLSAWREAVRRLVRAHRIDVVVATSDAGVAGLLGLDLGIPTCPQIDDRHVPLIDKGLLATLCSAARVPYPATHAPAGPDDDRRLAASASRPTVIKAARSAVAVGDRLVVLPGASVAPTADATLRALAGIRARGGEPIVQEFVRGQKLQAIIVRRAGRTSFGFAFAVERSFPRAGGTECTALAIQTDSGTGDLLVRALERLADAAGYEGLVQAEFYRTADGRVVVVDVNPRLWGSLAFPELLGLETTLRAVRDVLGLPPGPAPLADVAGRRYHHALREVGSLVTGETGLVAPLRAMRRGDVWDLPDLSDPLPDVLWAARALGTRARRATAVARARVGSRRPS